MKGTKIFKALINEIDFFKSHPRDMRTVLLTNMIYALVLPIVDIFVGAYIMRSSNDQTMVAVYQLAVYTGIPITFFINGFLLKSVKIVRLYSLGMLMSGISMIYMMSLEGLNHIGVAMVGLVMGISFGFFWANRDFLALDTTNDGNRNYYYGVETFFYTIAAIIIPLFVGWFIVSSQERGWFGGTIIMSYRLVTIGVFLLTIIATIVAHRDKFRNPKQKKFVYFKFDVLWQKMLVLSGLKGLAQGYLVTAPAILVMTLVGDENSLGLIQSISGVVTAVILYFLGRFAKPEHRIYIFIAGLIAFVIGTIANAILFSSVGVIIFMLMKVLFQPLHDIAYFPIQMHVINVVSKKEKRSEFAYLFNHEFGLYVGRFTGLVLFISLSFGISNTFALKYSLPIIAIVQLLSIPLAKHIIKRTGEAEGELKQGVDGL
ncbi:MAG: MFS transporter [Salinivirgaceae bacterium]|nr:MFS transporter [Salinivirgaceae bacterium]